MFSSGLEWLAEWLQDHDITQVVLEATGQYGKPIWYVLEERGFQLLLVNARHVKLLPGRKTDVGDAAWLAELLEHGLLRGSFVPPPAIRELRDLTRDGKRLIQAHTAECQRIHKTLEDASIRLGSVATDVLGVSGRAMLRALLAGERDPKASPSWPGAGCATGAPSCAKRCGVASAPTTPCWCGWPWTTWSSWSGPSPHWTPRSTG
jgi:transposase